MPKFISKPTIVDAVQFDGVNLTEYMCRQAMSNCPKEPHVHTMSGDSALIHAGDWTVREPGGQGAYPCNPTVFELRYERYIEPAVPAPLPAAQ